ncbi:hypothetical protein B4N89_27395 [Embleya scabrispora]|uniref:GIY-YIG domain-containing protein n=1 Tax=Embleya scabrispora TaxID=159449 RepID=A0A1T3P528_9ACTN|nr:hypothetical protein [Embleya scabrispora]OPC84154.1 hypothetical protein B4N89_27395 [Embleya scabrispora]
MYRLYDAKGALLYVGIGINPYARLTVHARQKPWWPQVASGSVVWFDNRPSALAAELRAIRVERSRHNVIGSPWAPRPRTLDRDELLVGQLRKVLPTALEEVHGHLPKFVVDASRARKRVAVVVPVEWYERAKAALEAQG